MNGDVILGATPGHEKIEVYCSSSRCRRFLGDTSTDTVGTLRYVCPRCGANVEVKIEDRQIAWQKITKQANPRFNQRSEWYRGNKNGDS